MPLNLPEPPLEASKIVSARVKQVAKQGQFYTRALSQARPQALNLTAPHPIYTLSFSDILQQRPLEASPLTGWRYLIQSEATAIASAEVLTGGATPAFSQFNEGPYVRSTVNKIVTAEALPQVNSGAYELRLLRVPALYVMALWLKDTVGDQDLLLPMQPVPDGLESERVYGAAEFLAILENLAQQQQFDNSPVS